MSRGSDQRTADATQCLAYLYAHRDDPVDHPINHLGLAIMLGKVTKPAHMKERSREYVQRLGPTMSRLAGELYPGWSYQATDGLANLPGICRLIHETNPDHSAQELRRARKCYTGLRRVTNNLSVSTDPVDIMVRTMAGQAAGLGDAAEKAIEAFTRAMREAEKEMKESDTEI